MGRFNIIYLITLIIFVACDNDNRVCLPQDFCPYQVFSINESTHIFVFVYDNWGESNNIYLQEYGNIYRTTFNVDPISYVKCVRNDTIIMQFDCPVSNNNDLKVLNPDFPQNKLGKYSIIYEYHYESLGETLYPYCAEN